jgi:hypothetical protein
MHSSKVARNFRQNKKKGKIHGGMKAPNSLLKYQNVNEMARSLSPGRAKGIFQ